MTPSEFAAKWSAAVKERTGSKEHFVELCHMLGYPTPTQIDPTGEWYAFEKGAEQTEGSGDRFADVWKRGHFGWVTDSDIVTWKGSAGSRVEFALRFPNDEVPSWATRYRYLGPQTERLEAVVARDSPPDRRGHGPAIEAE